MAESAFYLLTFVIAVSVLTICPKLTEKMNFLVGIMMSYVTVLCVGALGAFLMNAAKVTIRILTMGIVYIFIALLGMFVCIQKKTIQRLFIRKWDIVAVVALSLIPNRRCRRTIV